MGNRKKSSCRELADFVADTGVIPGNLDYETYVGLQLNLTRIRLRKVYNIALATSIANSTKSVPIELAESVSDTSEQAEKLMFDINSARERASVGWE